MHTEQDWQKLYNIAVLETDWSIMEDRVRAAERALKQRLHDLSQDHGGTPQELHAIAETRLRLDALQNDVARWRESNPERKDDTARVS